MNVCKTNSHFTFKHNIGKGRHGWIRLTPAYSIILVSNILEHLPDARNEYVLDPFAGTGTTGLVSSTFSIPCDLYETNPFLEWVARAKTQHYLPKQIENAQNASSQIVREAKDYPVKELWRPNIFKIERWWSPSVLDVLARVCYGISLRSKREDGRTIDLLKVAFCRLIIKWSNAAFNHQSMSFKSNENGLFLGENVMEGMLSFFESEVQQLLTEASENPRANVNVCLHNSKKMPWWIRNRYTCVITSPPYANRMSYIREVRPYMYWLDMIRESRQAADIDWNATGGAWGTATSRLLNWTPEGFFANDKEFLDMIKKIATESQLLANYVYRYFEDMHSHFSSLPSVLKQNARVHYVVGNSKFYDTIVPTEQIYARLLKKNKFEDVSIETLRKRGSKKELYEYQVSATWKTPFDEA